MNNNNNNGGDDQFDFGTCCVFCRKTAKINGKLGKNVEQSTVSDKFLLSVKTASEKRSPGDEWTQKVLSLVNLELIGLNFLFHENCRIGFRTNKPMPKTTTSATPKFEYRKGFLEIVALIRAKKKAIYSITELIEEMNECSEGNGYSFNQMKINLVRHMGNEIIISTFKNKKTLVTLQTSCEEILNEYYESSTTETANRRAIQEVSKIILHDIKNVTPNKCTYPSPDDMTLCEAQKFLPVSLNTLLSNIITGHNAQLKIISIGQAIIQSAHRENVLSPLQLALAVQMHYFTGSK